MAADANWKRDVLLIPILVGMVLVVFGFLFPKMFDTRTQLLEKQAAELRQELSKKEAVMAALSNRVIYLQTTFTNVLASRAAMESLTRYGKPPDGGWVVYGEPCHDVEEGHGRRHRRIHNRNFNLLVEGKAADIKPSIGDLAIVKEFANVWKGPPTQDDNLDSYEFLPVPFVKHVANIFTKTKWYEQYPPEDTIGVLVPGQKVRIVGLHDITLGQTFVEYRLVAD